MFYPNRISISESEVFSNAEKTGLAFSKIPFFGQFHFSQKFLTHRERLREILLQPDLVQQNQICCWFYKPPHSVVPEKNNMGCAVTGAHQTNMKVHPSLKKYNSRKCLVIRLARQYIILANCLARNELELRDMQGKISACFD